MLGALHCRVRTFCKTLDLHHGDRPETSTPFRQRARRDTRTKLAGDEARANRTTERRFLSRRQIHHLLVRENILACKHLTVCVTGGRVGNDRPAL